MRFIIVTRKCDGTRMYVNPKNICAFYSYVSDKDTTLIQFSSSGVEVKESADSIASMIERTRLQDIANGLSDE